MEQEMKPVVTDDLELITTNKELINVEKHNGFAIKKSPILMKLKKLPGNIYKLFVLLLAGISQTIPEFLHKVPGIGYLADLLVDGVKVYAMDQTFEAIYDNLIVPYHHILKGSQEYKLLWYEYTKSDGMYYATSLQIKTIALFIMEHPGLVIAGGAVLAGVAVKLVSILTKKLRKVVKYNQLNDSEKEIYHLLKDILKHARKIKKTENGKILVNDLNITFDIVDKLTAYPETQQRIKGVLQEIKADLESKNDQMFEQHRLELETIVFDFEKEHNNYLYQEMNLIEDSDANIKAIK